MLNSEISLHLSLTCTLDFSTCKITMFSFPMIDVDSSNEFLFSPPLHLSREIIVTFHKYLFLLLKVVKFSFSKKFSETLLIYEPTLSFRIFFLFNCHRHCLILIYCARSAINFSKNMRKKHAAECTVEKEEKSSGKNTQTHFRWGENLSRADLLCVV